MEKSNACATPRKAISRSLKLPAHLPYLHSNVSFLL
ncbi:BZ3500_MvSof-1268-A1-R1_Chr1-3g02316 [Microbotryum saponariae]|uniref:BZ3500_MvSof-1268-A1-R1_Chr1-3g02316 protein n=1 Tax=Microbotryum saponariae TaxID=289078 RepID=A0A2X0KPY8_9BASI|nr:BZ3500_MvSof-1268-A1-R1_Chr1-3g02316 [Microbotryum saponariae]SCZ95969.1 BZ3501_MvSof-1269-A2-R1_Chr1-3g01919 [Microbotryum saponariae]